VIFCSKLNSELTFPKSICSSSWLLPWWRTWYPKKKISQWSELQWFSLINSVTSWLLRKLFILNTKYMGFSPSSKKRKKITKNYFLNQEAGATMENRAHGTCQHPWGKNKRISASKSLSRHGWQHSCRPLHNKNKNGITFYHDMTHPWKKKLYTSLEEPEPPWKTKYIGLSPSLPPSFSAMYFCELWRIWGCRSTLPA